MILNEYVMVYTRYISPVNAWMSTRDVPINRLQSASADYRNQQISRSLQEQHYGRRD